jgi:hypothetical protein
VALYRLATIAATFARAERAYSDADEQHAQELEAIAARYREAAVAAGLPDMDVREASGEA